MTNGQRLIQLHRDAAERFEAMATVLNGPPPINTSRLDKLVLEWETAENALAGFRNRLFETGSRMGDDYSNPEAPLPEDQP